MDCFMDLEKCLKQYQENKAAGSIKVFGGTEREMDKERSTITMTKKLIMKDLGFRMKDMGMEN